MLLESVTLINFRCFGPEKQKISFQAGLTALIGNNGAGKTALMQAMLRMFSVTNEHRRLKRQDFHVPPTEETPATQRMLSIEAILAFPELASDDADTSSVPEFFHQMAADDAGDLKCRLRLDAVWTDDGSLEGAIEQKFYAIRTFSDSFEETDCNEIKATDRSRIQMIYVPAVRDGTSQITAFLRGRLWRAITWSQGIKDALSESGNILNASFQGEAGIDTISQAVKHRWQEVHMAGTDTTPAFRPLDLRFQEFIRKVDIIFHPDESGRDRSLEDLSDGQRSLFHLAMAAATLDIEKNIASGTDGNGFQANSVALPALTLIAVEEPENNLSPFYLSRIIRQIEDVTAHTRAQAFVSSHSPSILARIIPEKIRHFRLKKETRSAQVREIKLPPDTEEASKFIREAVRTYPELYFAKFVILGEGSSEEIVLPRLAEVMNVPIDKSFVAVVPLGGRHVNHLWRLLTDLDIPFATLLDADTGRLGGGWGRVKTTCQQLIANGIEPNRLFANWTATSDLTTVLNSFDALVLNTADEQRALKGWIENFRSFGVFFCWPLDLDWSMLKKFLASYQLLPAGMAGPRVVGNPKASVLGDDGDPSPYGTTNDERFLWYRYLFLGRSKPSTHIRVLASITDDALRDNAPDELVALIRYAEKSIFGDPAPETE